MDCISVIHYYYTMYKFIQKILCKTQTYLGTDLRYLIQGGFWLVMAQTLNALVAFLMLIAFANLLPKETFGMYKYILSITAILAIPTLDRMRVAITRSVAVGDEGTLLVATKTQMRWGLLGGIGAIIVALYYFTQGNIQLSLCFLISSAFLPFMDSLNSANAFLAGRKLFKETSWVVATERIIELIVTVLILLYSNNILLVVFGYFTINTLTRLVVFYWVVKRFKPNKSVNNSAIGYGKHLSLMSIVGAISGELDKILLWQFLGPLSLAVYSIAQSPVMRIQSVLSSIESLAFPKFATQEKESIKKTLPRKMLHLRLLMIAITAVYIISAPLLYQWFLPKYASSVIYSQFFAIILLFLPQKFTGSALTAQTQTRSLYIFSIISPIVKIGFMLILIPIFGIAGAIAASIILYITNAFILNYFFKRM